MAPAILSAFAVAVVLASGLGALGSEAVGSGPAVSAIPGQDSGRTGSVPLEAASAMASAALRASAVAPIPYGEPGRQVAGSSFVGPFAGHSVGPSGSLDLLVSLRFSNASRLGPLLQALSDPSSAEYHRYLTAAQFDREFGGSPTVYASLLSYLSSFGVRNLTSHPDRLAVSFSATVAEAEAIFGTPIGAYRTSSGEPYYAPGASPSLPAPLAPYIADVVGLSNYSEYLLHLAPLGTVVAPPVGGPLQGSGGSAKASIVSPESGPHSAVSPGGSLNPFSNTTVTSNGLTNTYDQPVYSNLNGKTGYTCDTTFCGDFVQAPDLQVAYNETGLFKKFGYPVNATVATILWSDTICSSNSGSCGSNGFYNARCGSLPFGSAAWDFYLPDVTSYWNYSLPSGEPKPNAYSMAESGYSYGYAAGSQGYSASCDSGGAESESTLDVDMLGSLAPGANVFQVFGGANSEVVLDTAFSDILSPSTSEFSSDGGFDTAAAIARLQNVSVITNSWTSPAPLSATWTNDLETAAARGITVLGATGDSGTVLAPPAEIGDNTYGTIAVGGTTASINVTSLLRGAPHLAVTAAPYYGVGTGEIGWYEPAGTVYGFSGTYGGTGGVAGSTSYYRASWFNASADAVSVANLVASGNFRAEPDVAAIANDTLINLEQGPYSLNFTCWVTIACGAISTYAEGVSSGSLPTVSGTYMVGTSIATPVTGGLVATVDYALHQRHEGWLGYLDPSAYAQGQKEFSGKLTLSSFYDVNTYTDAGGLSADYEAKAGYDLATGWGVIDAGNYSQNAIGYNTTFTESGLPPSTLWSVTVTPTVGDAGCSVSGSSCSNPVTLSTTGPSLVFAETYGLFTYTVASSNPSYSGHGGSFRSAGADTSAGITFSAIDFGVSFNESGLPPGTTWFVNVSGGASHSGSAGSTISFTEPNGSYSYTIGSSNTSWSAPPGSFAVSGTSVSRSVAFALVTYSVSVAESGLPAGTEWFVNITGGASSHALAGTDIGFNEPNGTYGYTLGSANRSWAGVAGSFHVHGGATAVNVVFSLVTYSLTFTESGLSPGTFWSVIAGGVLRASTTPTIQFNEPNGTFPFVIPAEAGFSPSPGLGTVQVNGSPAEATIDFAAGPSPTISAAPAQGPVGATVTIQGTGFTGDSAVVTVFDSRTLSSSNCTAGSFSTNLTGGFSCTLHVPTGTVGTLVNASDVDGAYASSTFWVTTPTLALTPAQGPVGATVTVSGHGFSVYTPIASLVFGGVPIGSCLSGSLTTGTIAPGGFSCTLRVPGGTTSTAVTASDVGGAHASSPFTVTAPYIVLSPTQGPVGAMVIAVGHGFSVRTALGSLVFDGVAITSCLSGSLVTGGIAPGGFSCGLRVPSVVPGTVSVVAKDVGGASAAVPFLITSLALYFTPAQGPINASVTAVGHGFSVATPIASLVFDGVLISTCTSGSLTTGTIAPGGFSCSFHVPRVPAGTVSVNATDPGGARVTISFWITVPALVVTPSNGTVGSPVTVTGHGFSVNVALGSLVFDGVTITAANCTSGSLTTGIIAPGGFTCTFNVPGGTSGTGVVATDVGGGQASSTFEVT